jgi:hypothetical protein
MHARHAVLAPTLVALGLLAALARPARAEIADPALACERAAATAEQAHGLPAGILAAIGRVESGMRDATGQARPWPWTIDAEGAGTHLPTREAAIATVADLQRGGMRSIDVGCFQVNLQQHPNAFPTLADAFDPAANADYAARFLASLEQRSGNWADAVMQYHSAEPTRGIPYRDRVLASWTGAPPLPVATSLPPVASIPGLHIWTPSPAGSAPSVIALARPGGALPVVMLPVVTHHVVP